MKASSAGEREVVVWGFIGLLLIVWLALVVIGAVVEGLFWLIAVGAVLFLATAAFGSTKRSAGGRVQRY